MPGAPGTRKTWSVKLTAPPKDAAMHLGGFVPHQRIRIYTGASSLSKHKRKHLLPIHAIGKELKIYMLVYTVEPEIYARILFSRTVDREN
jgi:hypothetical protein